MKAEGIVTTTDNQYSSSNVNGSIVEVLAKEGSAVTFGDVLIRVSNGQENSQAEAILQQLKNHELKEAALSKYIEALSTKTNTLSNAGYELEYYGKMEYYLSLITSNNTQNNSTQNTINTKSTKLTSLQTELTALQNEVTTLESKTVDEEDKEQHAMDISRRRKRSRRIRSKGSKKTEET